MKKEFDIDYNKLENKLYKKAYRFEEVEPKLVKVAFDIYKFKNDEKAKLWQLHSADDGKYIVSLYEEDEDSIEKLSDWKVVVNKSANNVNFYYKDEYITKLAKKHFPFSDNEIENTLPSKLSNNKDLVQLLLKNVDDASKSKIFSKYPELKYI